MAYLMFQAYSGNGGMRKCGKRALVVCALAIGLSAAGMAQAQKISVDDEIVVKVQPLSEIVTAQRQSAPATVEAVNRAIVSARVPANINSIEVEVGERVTKGTVLAQLDSRDYDLALEQAKAMLQSTEAQIAQANLRLKRAEELSGNQYISADDLLARETDVVVLTANRASNNVAIRIAENDVAKTKIVAPFDSVVVARTAQVGSYVTPAAPMFELVQLDAPEVEAQVASDLIQNIESGERVRFERNGKFWPLKLMRVSPVVQSDTGSQIVRLGFTRETAAVGSSGRVSWQGAGGMLPSDMLLQRGNDLGVFVVDGDRARFHIIENAQEGRPATTSLSPDTRLVTLGRFKLQDGQRLKIVVN